MCFGPVASFTASGILASIGALVLRNIRQKKEIWFAAFPILFAAQQFIEGLLWLMIKTGQSEAVLSGLTFAYLTFAYSLWPILCPASVLAIEYAPRRKIFLKTLLVLGLVTSGYLFYFIIKNPFSAIILNCSIQYQTQVAGARWFTSIYVLATVLPYFISSHRAILVFGFPNLVLCLIAYYFYSTAFISVWCFFAAITSLTLYFFLRNLHHQPILGH